MSNESEKPASELYPGHAEELKKRAALAENIERAHAAVLPGALREAFAGQPVTAEGQKLQPVTLWLTSNLERINSPLLEVVRLWREEFSKPVAASLPPEKVLAEKWKRVNARVDALKYNDAQIAETIFVFVRPQEGVSDLLDKGLIFFRREALKQLGKLHPTQAKALQRACIQHYVESFATIIGYGSPPDKGEAVFPAPSPSTVTASVGG